MRVKVDHPYTLAELKTKLETAFPEYKIAFRGPKALIISHGNIAGTMIVGEKKHFVQIQETFPTLGGLLIFAVLLLLFAVIIPMVIFLYTIKPKQVQLRDTIADFIRREYGSGPINASTDLLDDKI